MSTTDNSSNGTTEANGEQTEEIKNPDAVLKKNRELLAKLKIEQDKAKSIQEKLEQIEQEKLAQAGKKDELIESLKTKTKTLEEQYKQATQSFALKTVNSQVLEAARAMGCEKPEVIMKLADLSSVTVNDDFSVDSEALKIALDKVKEDVPALFKKVAAAPRDGVPATGDVKAKTPDQMSIAELKALYEKKALGK